MTALLELIGSFFKIGSLTLGGGMAMLPLIRQEMLAHGWMTDAEFLNVLGIAEVTPGPLAVNTATFVGYRVAGIAGAAAATAALAMPSLIGVCLLAPVWQRHRRHPVAEAVFAVLRPVVTGMILAAAVRLLLAAMGPGSWEWRSCVIAAAVYLAAARERANPAAILLGGSLLGALLYGVLP